MDTGAEARGAVGRDNIAVSHSVIRDNLLCMGSSGAASGASEREGRLVTRECKRKQRRSHTREATTSAEVVYRNLQGQE